MDAAPLFSEIMPEFRALLRRLPRDMQIHAADVFRLLRERRKLAAELAAYVPHTGPTPEKARQRTLNDLGWYRREVDRIEKLLGRLVTALWRWADKHPPKPPKPPKPLCDGNILIDVRSLIRSSKSIESTTGPPRRPRHENGPGAGNSTGPVFMSSRVGTTRGDSPTSAEKNKPQFAERTVTPKNRGRR